MSITEYARSLLQNLNPHIQGYISTLLPSEGLMGETVKYDAVAVTSIEGEHLKLDKKVVTQVYKANRMLNQIFYNTKFILEQQREKSKLFSFKEARVIWNKVIRCEKYFFQTLSGQYLID